MRDEIAKPKEETLEEAAENYSCKCSKIREPSFIALDGFVEGAKWQAERMYSEKDMISFANFYFKEEFNSTMQDCKSTEEIWDLWFEQFKKK